MCWFPVDACAEYHQVGEELMMEEQYEHDKKYREHFKK